MGGIGQDTPFWRSLKEKREVTFRRQPWRHWFQGMLRRLQAGDRLECYDLFRAICARLRFGDLSVWPICSSWRQA
jgi:hypothetical protein